MDDSDQPEPVETPNAFAGAEPLPWHRRGVVWLVVVLVTAIAAWIFGGWAEANLDGALGAARWLP